MEHLGDQPEKYIPPLLQKWDMLQSDIKVAFDKRDYRNTAAPMEMGIEYFIEFIYLTNGLLVNQMKDVDFSSLTLKPVNISERLQFIKARPTIYPSFIQLKELFDEQIKHYAKGQAITKGKHSD